MASNQQVKERPMPRVEERLCVLDGGGGAGGGAGGGHQLGLLPRLDGDHEAGDGHQVGPRPGQLEEQIRGDRDRPVMERERERDSESEIL